MKATPKTYLGASLTVLLACMTLPNKGFAQAAMDLIAEGQTVVGRVEALVLDGLLYLDIQTSGTWTIDTARLAVGRTLADIPTGSGGNPNTANFPFVEVGGTGVQNIFTIIPLNSTACDVPFLIATHVKVRDGSASRDDSDDLDNSDDSEDSDDSEHSGIKAAWAGNSPFPCQTGSGQRCSKRGGYERDGEESERHHVRYQESEHRDDGRDESVCQRSKGKKHERRHGNHRESEDCRSDRNEYGASGSCANARYFFVECLPPDSPTF